MKLLFALFYQHIEDGFSDAFLAINNTEAKFANQIPRWIFGMV